MMVLGGGGAYEPGTPVVSQTDSQPESQSVRQYVSLNAAGCAPLPTESLYSPRCIRDSAVEPTRHI